MKERDGSFTSYTAGAPSVVNREFTERYILSDEDQVIDSRGLTLSGQGARGHVRVYEHMEAGCYIVAFSVRENYHPFAFETLEETQRYASRYTFHVTLQWREGGFIIESVFENRYESEKIVRVGRGERIPSGEVALSVEAGGWRGHGGHWTVNIRPCFE